jgi:hypothetical protein
MISDEQYKETFKENKITDAFLPTVLKLTKNVPFLNLCKFFSCYGTNILKCCPQNMYVPFCHISINNSTWRDVMSNKLVNVETGFHEGI